MILAENCAKKLLATRYSAESHYVLNNWSLRIRDKDIAGLVRDQNAKDFAEVLPF